MSAMKVAVDLLAHHRTVLGCLALVGGTAPVWRAALALLAAGHDGGGVSATITELVRRGWVRVVGPPTALLADSEVELIESGRGVVFVPTEQRPTAAPPAERPARRRVPRLRRRVREAVATPPPDRRAERQSRDRRVARAVKVLHRQGIDAFRVACEICDPGRRCFHPRVWALGRPEAAYRVNDERLIRHAQVALQQAGEPPDPALG